MSSGKKLLPNDKKLISAWAMYDWANSVYSLSIATAIFPIYYEAVTRHGGSDEVHFLGRQFVNTALYSYALSFSFLVIALVSPLLSSIADYRGNKLSFMKFFCYLGSLSCIALAFFNGENLWLGIGFFVLATVGFCGSIVFYNSFLPEIASDDRQDAVSAKGFALGYIGSVILLIVNLLMIQKFTWFGFHDAATPTKISFVMTGLWWAGFAQITFRALKRFEPPLRKGEQGRSAGSLFGGYQELRKVLQQLGSLTRLRMFLFAFFFYSMGVQTVMYLASLFGKKELHLETGELILTVLIIQLVAVAGSYLFSFLSGRIGNMKSLLIACFTWIGICVGAYFIQNDVQFFLIAFCVGMVMGGIQSLSRSTYSRLLPPTTDTASFFSFYDVSEKVAIVLGTIAYGVIEEKTGSMRNSLFVLILFFVVGMVGLLFVHNKKEAEPLKN